MNAHLEDARDADHAPTLSDIEAIATKAFATIPEEFRPHVKNVRIQIDEFPSDEVQKSLRLDSPFDALAVYQGPTVAGPHPSEASRICIYRRPILDYWNESDESLQDIVRHALFHELGHHFGFTNEELEEIEMKAQRDDALTDRGSSSELPEHLRPKRAVNWLFRVYRYINTAGWLILMVATLYFAIAGYPEGNADINSQAAFRVGLFALIQPFVAISSALRLDTSGASGRKLLLDISLSLIGFLWSFALSFYFLSHYDYTAFNIKDMDGPTALYFTVITFATIGYGDIVPTSTLAKMLVILAVALSMLFNLVVFTKIVNWLGSSRTRI